MTEKKSFLLRIDREVLEALQKWASDDLRSLNGHLEFLLRDALKRAKRTPARSSPDARPSEE
ncbi:MAG TPA: Arc family DNA-binding protein [Gemmatimonadaceae bacterium]